jgi:hypothetical protein
MTNIEEVIFQSIKDNNAIHLTQCSMEDHPDIVLAIMVENVPDNYVGPPELQVKFEVEIPYEGETQKVSIWFSNSEDNDKMAMIIQKFFEWRFPNLVINDNTEMGIYEPGKLTVKSG